MKIFPAMPSQLLLAIVTTVFVTACATTPNTISNVSPNTDFSQFSTFGFFDPLATDKQGYESMESNFLKVAVAQQLDRRGLTYSESPDLLVNFYIHTEEKETKKTFDDGCKPQLASSTAAPPPSNSALISSMISETMSFALLRPSGRNIRPIMLSRRSVLADIAMPI